MILGLCKEPSHETRVSLLADAVATLTKKGITVLVEKDAGEDAFCSNMEYEKAGAKIVQTSELYSSSEILLSINRPDSLDKGHLPSVILIGVYHPLHVPEVMVQWAADGLTVFSLDMLPRTTRAQSMDVLSSQGNIAGYKAVLTAANLYGRYFPMFMTAAGTITPAKVLILGAGVAGLQAIATARRLGGVVEVFDTRPEVKEEVISLGAKFVEVQGAADASKAGGYAVQQTEEFMHKQQARIAESIAKSDIVITTANIPGAKAPVLITEEMIKSMRKGSVIIDIAAASGGNTPFTKNNQIIAVNEVIIVGNSNLPATMPFDASKLYGKNVLNFLSLITSKEGQLKLNWEDDLVKGCCIMHGGQIIHARVKEILNK